MWHELLKNDYREFHNFWNKAAAFSIFSGDFILFLFADYCPRNSQYFDTFI